MRTRSRKSSTRVTLVLIGAAALAGCGRLERFGRKPAPQPLRIEGGLRRRLGGPEGLRGTVRAPSARSRGVLVRSFLPLRRRDHRRRRPALQSFDRQPEHLARRFRRERSRAFVGRVLMQREDFARRAPTGRHNAKASASPTIRSAAPTGTSRAATASPPTRSTRSKRRRRSSTRAVSTPPRTSSRAAGSRSSRFRESWHERVAASWRAREPSLFGRFDLAFDGRGAPKLLEYNADTPTALLEASVVQWHWMQQAILPRHADADQFNSLHEKLIANWRALGVTWSARNAGAFHLRRRQRRGPRQSRLPARRGDAGRRRHPVRRRRGHRLERGERHLRRHRRRRDLGADEALSVGVARRRSRSARNLLDATHPRDRARVEDAAVEQGHPADPLGALPGSPEPAAGLFRARPHRRRLGRKAAAAPARAPTS